MKVGIIGAESFVAKTLESELLKKNIKVRKFSHNSNASRAGTFNILQPRLPETTDLDAIIYFSWLPARDESSQYRSQIAASYVARWCESHSVNALFISSMAASVNEPTSSYGKAKKDSEFEFLRRGLSVIRPGTIMPSGNIAGNSLVELQQLSTLGKFLLSSIVEIQIPIVQETSVVSTISNWLLFGQSPQLNLSQRIMSVQKIAGVKTGFLPISFLSLTSFFLPSKLKDRIRVLIDLQA